MKTKISNILTLVIMTLVLANCKDKDDDKGNGGKLPDISTMTITNIGNTTASGGGFISDAGSSSVDERGVCWDTTKNPVAFFSSKMTNGSGIGTFKISLTGLKPGTKYYVRAYATNKAGTAYGNEVSFTTTGTNGGLGYNCNNGSCVIEINGAYSSLSDCNSACGGVSGYNCTGGNCVPDNASPDYPSLSACESACGSSTKYNCSNGNCVQSSTGTYSSLSACQNACTSSSTKYNYSNGNCVTATNGTYASLSACQNACGGGAYYCYRGVCQPTLSGSGGTYSTLAACESLCKPIPEVTTTAISNITYSGAQSGGYIGWGSNITERGLCYSKNPNPTIADTKKTSTPATTGSYSITLTNLAEKTKYYVRAYATNGWGTGYGEERSFTTLNITYDCIQCGCMVNNQQSGVYSSLAACQASACMSNCTQGYNCSNGNCYYVSGNNSNPEYPTLSACQSSCTSSTPRYDCSSGNCVTATNGTYTSLSACQSACGSSSTKYNCSNGNCVQSASGTYSSLSACQSACGSSSCASMNAYVSTTNAAFASICGNSNDYSVTVKNNSSQALAIQIAIKKTDGTWDCGIVRPAAGSTSTYWTCSSSGQYSIRSMLDSDWVSNCTFGSCP